MTGHQLDLVLLLLSLGGLGGILAGSLALLGDAIRGRPSSSAGTTLAGLGLLAMTFAVAMAALR